MRPRQSQVTVLAGTGGAGGPAVCGPGAAQGWSAFTPAHGVALLLSCPSLASGSGLIRLGCSVGGSRSRESPGCQARVWSQGCGSFQKEGRCLLPLRDLPASRVTSSRWRQPLAGCAAGSAPAGCCLASREVGGTGAHVPAFCIPGGLSPGSASLSALAGSGVGRGTAASRVPHSHRCSLGSLCPASLPRPGRARAVSTS